VRALPESVLSPALATALNLHRARRLQAAKAAYLGVLSASLDPAVAVLLGLVQRRLGVEEPGLLGMAKQAELLRLGELLRAAGEGEEAIALLEGSTEPRGSPGRAAARWDLLGRLRMDTGAFGLAEAAFRRAVEGDPAEFRMRAHLATALAALGRHTEAESALEGAIRLAPDQAELYFNLGTLRLQRGEADRALAPLQHALRLHPDHLKGALNLGTALRELGRLEEAEGRLRPLIHEAPVQAEARWNLALLLLQQERWAEGWSHYEARRELSGFAMDRPPLPHWQGQPVERLVVYAEQGLGDTFQFLRFLQGLSERVKHLIFRVQDPLVPLLTGGAAQVIGRSAGWPEADAAFPLLSAPSLGLWPPPAPPYLRPDPARQQRLRLQLGRKKPLQIGLNWQGSRSYKADAQRSIPAASLTPLFQHPDRRWIALQRGEPLPPGVEEWPDLDAEAAFLDSAALLLSLDLFITSDTALAHLAGALGCPVWLLLPAHPDWRWGLTGSHCLWYPTMRIFRQEQPGDWAGVIARVEAALGDT
jgi:tetratricopeptide (TPR) repeat protein